MSVFSDAIDAIFADPNIGEDAFFLCSIDAEPVACRVSHYQGDRLAGFGGSKAVMASNVIDVRVSEVAKTQGGFFRIGSNLYRVLGAPQLDETNLVWNCEADLMPTEE